MIMGNSWDQHLQSEYNKEYFTDLENKVEGFYRTRDVLPAKENIFKAFYQTPFDQVKCVIIGQDPYPTPGVACGLSFSVNVGATIPASLKNIFNEVVADLDIPYPSDGNLSSWAQQGVLMLNSVLTTEARKPGAHKNLGWQQFTDKAISELSEHRTGIVFLLWGRFAQSKANLIDKEKHLVLETSHPSPHSVNLGFKGCSHFSKTNDYLIMNGETPIDWDLS